MKEKKRSIEQTITFLKDKNMEDETTPKPKRRRVLDKKDDGKDTSK